MVKLQRNNKNLSLAIVLNFNWLEDIWNKYGCVLLNLTKLIRINLDYEIDLQIYYHILNSVCSGYHSGFTGESNRAQYGGISRLP
jgi:hypothetical protein